MEKEYTHFYCPGPYPGIERFKACIGQRSFPEHLHEGYVLGVVESGCQILVAGGVPHVAGAGSLIFLNPSELHAVRVARASHVRYQTLHFPAALMRQIVGRDLFIHSPVVHSPQHALLAVRTFEQLDMTTNCEQWDIGLRALLHEVAPLHHTPTEPVGSVYDGRVHSVISLMDQSVAESIRVTAIADSMGMSTQHLIRLFKNATGVTPYSYLLARRTAWAKQLLTDLSPAEAAICAGFSDQSHLTRRLQACYGVTPSVYRRLLAAPL